MTDTTYCEAPVWDGPLCRPCLRPATKIVVEANGEQRGYCGPHAKKVRERQKRTLAAMQPMDFR